MLNQHRYWEKAGIGGLELIAEHHSASNTGFNAEHD